jgi:hypothetical protein
MSLRTPIPMWVIMYRTVCFFIPTSFLSIPLSRIFFQAQGRFHALRSLLNGIFRARNKKRKIELGEKIFLFVTRVYANAFLHLG